MKQIPPENNSKSPPDPWPWLLLYPPDPNPEKMSLSYIPWSVAEWKWWSMPNDLDDDGHDLSHDDEDDLHLHHRDLHHRRGELEGVYGDGNNWKDGDNVMKMTDFVMSKVSMKAIAEMATMKMMLSMMFTMVCWWMWQLVLIVTTLSLVALSLEKSLYWCSLLMSASSFLWSRHPCHEKNHQQNNQSGPK